MVTSIHRDRYGFIWIGTYNGLNRYDGSKFTIYQSSWDDRTALPDNHITALSEDKGNKIWIGTDKGLAYYDYNDGKIYRAYLQQPGGKVKTLDERVNALTTDLNGNVFIATNKGFFLRKEGARNFNQVSIPSHKSQNVQSLTIDLQGRVWVFVQECGLGLYDSKTNKISLVNTQLKAMTYIVGDKSGKSLWMGSESGIFSFDIRSGNIEDLNKRYHLNNRSVMQIHESADSKLWVATDGGGINLFDRPFSEPSIINTGKNNGKLSSGAIHVIFEDPERNIWLGTLRGGINILNSKSRMPIETIANDPDNTNSLINNFTRSFCEDRFNNIWIGTSGGGLSYWNSKDNIFRNYIPQKGNLRSLSSNFVLSIIEDNKKNIWLATLNGGINRYDRKSDSFVRYRCFNTATGNDDPSIWKLYLDKNGDIWAAATRGGGLYRYDPLMDKFALYDAMLTDISAMYQDRKGVFWVGNSSLIKIDPIRKRHFTTKISNTIHVIYEDKKERFWLGTGGGGLLLMDRMTGRIKRYTTADGLPDNTVLTILEDKQGMLWMSTFNGLCSFDANTGKFRRFFAADGLQSNQFNVNAALKLQSGELLFGGLKGFNRFYPERIKTNTDMPDLYLTDFRINEVSIQRDSMFEGSKNVINMKKIILDYNQASIAVDYVALGYPLARNINYAYYLENWDKHWNRVGNLRTAYYSRLNEGSYFLHIKSINANGSWSGKELTIEITILPPWYRTWWAYLGYLAVLISFPLVYLVYRSKQLKLKHEIELAKIKAEQDHLLNEKKLSFFTSISHEFKTPLTLIINPVKDLLMAGTEEKNGALNIVYKNAKRLLGLVDHLLLFRKVESESSELSAEPLSFVAFAREVFDCFTAQVNSKKIDFKFIAAELDMPLYADVDKIEIILFNLISNAVKFTPGGGQIVVEITQDEEMVYLSVEDSGPGIPPDLGDKLFDKYYQVKGMTKSHSGFGIGLYLVKTFLDLHHGSIHYYNNQIGGATFTMGMPKGTAHFKAGELLVENQVQDAVRTVADQSEHMFQQEPNPASESTTVQLDILISDRQSMMIIDDNADMRSYITSIFSNDYRIYEAMNGEVGLAMIRKYLPDIIISDINMDELDGVELCRVLKADNALNHIPVILITGEANSEIELQGFETGAVDFVAKPFERSLLVARVNNILRNRAELQHYFYNKVTLKNSVYNLSEADRDFIYKCINIIEQNLLESDFDVQRIANEMAMSYSSLYKRIKLITGRTVSDFIRFIRIRKAAELLINTNCNVNEAAMHVGFNDIKYFREHFVKIYGIKPSEFVKRHRIAFKKKYLMENEVTYNPNA